MSTAGGSDDDRTHRSVGRTLDAVASGVLFALMAVAVVIGFFLTAFFVMATDSCSDECRTSRVGLGYGITYGGFALAFVVAIAGAAVAGARGWVRSVWPFLGLVMIVLSVLVGADVAQSASG